MDLKVLKEKQISLFFSIFFGIFVSFQKKKLNLCVFPSPYTCLYVISYKCKYVLFHLNMLILFQKINMFSLFLKLNQFPIKKIPLNTLFKDLIPTCLVNLMFVHPNCFQIFNELKTWVVDYISPWMIIGWYFIQFEFYIYLKITKFSNVNPYFFFCHFIVTSLVRSNTEPKLDYFQTYSNARLIY